MPETLIKTINKVCAIDEDVRFVLCVCVCICINKVFSLSLASLAVCYCLERMGGGYSSKVKPGIFFIKGVFLDSAFWTKLTFY